MEKMHIFRCPNISPCGSKASCNNCGMLTQTAVFTVREEETPICTSSGKPMIKLREYQGESLIDLWRENKLL